MRTTWNNTADGRPSLSFPSDLFFWLLSFSYSSFMALFVQKILLPMWPALHAGHGLLKGDAIIFHNQAVQIAHQIQNLGWSTWSLLPPGGSANVGLLSALYVLFSEDPAWFIPFNAAAHATGALLIYRLGITLSRSNVGRLGGLLAAICFLVFPSALLWYGQIHKDAFTIAGTLLILNTWLEIDENVKTISWSRFFRLIFMVFMGVVLIGVFRPYHVLLILFGLLFSLVIIMPIREKMLVTLTRCATLLVVAVSAFMLTGVSSPSNDYVYGDNFGVSSPSKEPVNGDNFGVSSPSKEPVNGDNFGVSSPSKEPVNGANLAASEFQWQESSFIPAILDKGFRRASELRQHFIDYGVSVGAESGIDADIIPHNALETIKYLPRAFFIGLFSPFPTTWGERMSAPRLLAAMETAVWYLMTFGALITFLRFRSRNLFVGVVFCATILTVIAYVSPNVGTLYRLRYGLWLFFLLVGSVGWASFLLEYLLNTRKVSLEKANELTSSEATLASVHGIVHQSGSGPVVMLLALVVFLGFLTRDLLLIGKLGFIGEIDLFFAISAISMFFVNSLAVPLGEAFVPLFVAATKLKSEERLRLLRGTLGFAVLLLTGAWIVIELSAPLLVELVLGSHPAESRASAVIMLRCFSFVVLLSSWTIIGNAVLNSIGRPIQSAQLQLVVPFLTLIAVVLVPEEQAVYAAIYGMVVGTFANAIFVGWRVWALGYTFMPCFPRMAETQALRRQFWPLLAAALLPALLVPLNYFFAASAGIGTLSAWAISSKIVTLFASLANVGATAVVLPRLSYSFSSKHYTDIRQQANFLVAIGVWMGGLLMLGGFLFVRPICFSLLSGSLEVDQISQLVGIISIGLLQIPMIISSAMFNRLVIASGRSVTVMQAAMLGFSGNVLADITLVPTLGVLGVAVGALIGTSLSSVLVLARAYKSTGMTPYDLLIALAGWLMWIALCTSLFIENATALLLAGALLLGYAIVQFGALRHKNSKDLIL